MNDYTASSIKILTPEEAEADFIWLKVENLAQQYHTTNPFIQRLVDASLLAGTDWDWVEDRYLKKVPGTARNETFEAIHKELQNKAYRHE